MGTEVNPHLVAREDLQEYAFAILRDNAKLLAEAKRICPVAPTGALAGRYATFNDAMDFAITDAKRVANGPTADAKFGGKWNDYTLQPNALKIGMDLEIELPMAGSNVKAVERAKTRTLMAQAIGNFANDAYTILKAGRTAHATYGKWSDPNVDPIDQIEAAAIEIFEATGMWPNKVDITPQMWRHLKKNALSLKRFGGKNNAMKMSDVGEEAGGFDMQLVTGAGLSSGDFGQSTLTFATMLGTACWIYYSNPLATGDNATFAATLAVDEDLLTSVYEYMSVDGTQRFLRIPWFTKPVVVASALCRRIVYSA
jgi:hypothetical protein